MTPYTDVGLIFGFMRISFRINFWRHFNSLLNLSRRHILCLADGWKHNHWLSSVITFLSGADKHLIGSPNEADVYLPPD